MLHKELSVTKKSSVLLQDSEIKVTHGFATIEQINAFKKADNFEDSVNLGQAESYFEIWKDDVLMGLCNMDINIYDEEGCDKILECVDPEEILESYPDTDDELSVFMSLESVALLPKYRGKGYAQKTSAAISIFIMEEIKNIIDDNPNKFSSIRITSMADYISTEGERFHDQLTDNIEESDSFNEKLAMLDIELSIDIDAGY